MGAGVLLKAKGNFRGGGAGLLTQSAAKAKKTILGLFFGFFLSEPAWFGQDMKQPCQLSPAGLFQVRMIVQG